MRRSHYLPKSRFASLCWRWPCSKSCTLFSFLLRHFYMGRRWVWEREAIGRGRTLSVAGQKLFREQHRPQMGLFLFRAAISPACEWKWNKPACDVCMSASVALRQTDRSLARSAYCFDHFLFAAAAAARTMQQKQRLSSVRAYKEASCTTFM